MSQFDERIVRCYICGEKLRQTHILSSGSYTSPDLDTRPGQMLRSTMDLWVWECPFCKYTASSLDDETRIDPEFLKTEEYLGCSGLHFASPLAKQFYRQYLIQSREEDNAYAFYAILHAAWACDDAGDEENGTVCRKLALAEMEKLDPPGWDEEFRAIKADLLRRSGQFQQLLEEYNPADFGTDAYRRVVEFQIKKAGQQDARCYTFEEIDN